ncbi:MAG: hypothetical protein J3K34DRAFT_410421 [Monoraphidium minutum]|nr:MAG: hypothetical protein J3K34DRAFT_410421 [Monoraphidium minutum]
MPPPQQRWSKPRGVLRSFLNTVGASFGCMCGLLQLPRAVSDVDGLQACTDHANEGRAAMRAPSAQQRTRAQHPSPGMCRPAGRGDTRLPAPNRAVFDPCMILWYSAPPFFCPANGHERSQCLGRAASQAGPCTFSCPPFLSKPQPTWLAACTYAHARPHAAIAPERRAFAAG